MALRSWGGSVVLGVDSPFFSTIVFSVSPGFVSGSLERMGKAPLE